MSSARADAISPHNGIPGREGGAAPRARSDRAAGTLDRDHLLERLQRLRTIMPVFAQELAGARRQAAALRVENRRLLEEVRRLRQQHGREGLSTGKPG